MRTEPALGSDDDSVHRGSRPRQPGQQHRRHDQPQSQEHVQESQRPRHRDLLAARAVAPGGEMAGPSAESARGVSPRAAHRTGLEPLGSSGSCHSPKTAVFRLDPWAHPVSRWPIDPGASDPPLRSISITETSSLLRSSPPLPAASVLSASRLQPLAPFPLASTDRFSSSVH